TELVLERGAVHARLNASRPRRAVDVEHLVEVAQVDTDRAAVGVADVALHAADDGRAAAIGNRGRARVRAPVQDVGHVRLGTRGGDDVGRVGEIAAEGAHDVAERLAVCVPGPLGGAGLEGRARRGGWLE